MKSRCRADGGKGPASARIVSATGLSLIYSPTTRVMNAWPHGPSPDRGTTDLTRRVVDPAHSR